MIAKWGRLGHRGIEQKKEKGLMDDSVGER